VHCLPAKEPARSPVMASMAGAVVGGRDRNIWTPVIMHYRKARRILIKPTLFDLGVDHYLTKPFQPPGAGSPASGLVRRGTPKRRNKLTVVSLVPDPSPAYGYHPGELIKLTARKFWPAQLLDAECRQRSWEVRHLEQRLGCGVRGQRKCRRGLHRVSPQED
jgi:DNA-binding response OmpR family regulator